MKQPNFLFTALTLALAYKAFSSSNDSAIVRCSFDSSNVTSTSVVNEANQSLNLAFSGNCIKTADCLGMPNKAITLDGSTYLSCAMPSATVSQIAQGDFSLGIMIKTTYQTGSFQGRFDIVGIGDPINNGLFLSLNNSRGRIFLGNHGYYDTPDTLSDGKWHFLMATRSNGNVTLYLDGAVSDAGAYTDNLQPVTNIFTVGKHGTKSESYFKGDIDELYFYSRALSSDEVNALYLKSKTLPMTLYSPSDSVAANPIVFKWAPLKISIAYAVEIDTSASFTNPLVSIPTEDTVLQLTAPLATGSYFFRIGFNADDRSAFYFFDPKRLLCK